MSGLFVTVEGGEGTGKSGVVARLVETLLAAGVDVVASKEPGDSHIGSRVREILLGEGPGLDPRTEALLMAADRAEHVATVVRPCLEAGRSMICDRYLDSSVAYQGRARGLGEQVIRDLSDWATGGLVPDLTVVLDVDPRVGSSRRFAAGDVNRLDKESLAFHEAVREGFLAAAAREPERFRVVDASGSREDVFRAVLAQVAPLFGIPS